MNECSRRFYLEQYQPHDQHGRSGDWVPEIRGGEDHTHQPEDDHLYTHNTGDTHSFVELNTERG